MEVSEMGSAKRHIAVWESCQHDCLSLDRLLEGGYLRVLKYQELSSALQAACAPSS